MRQADAAAEAWPAASVVLAAVPAVGVRGAPWLGELEGQAANRQQPLGCRRGDVRPWRSARRPEPRLVRAEVEPCLARLRGCRLRQPGIHGAGGGRRGRDGSRLEAAEQLRRALPRQSGRSSRRVGSPRGLPGCSNGDAVAPDGFCPRRPNAGPKLVHRTPAEAHLVASIAGKSSPPLTQLAIWIILDTRASRAAAAEHPKVIP